MKQENNTGRRRDIIQVKRLEQEQKETSFWVEMTTSNIWSGHRKFGKKKQQKKEKFDISKTHWKRTKSYFVLYIY